MLTVVCTGTLYRKTSYLSYTEIVHDLDSIVFWNLSLFMIVFQLCEIARKHSAVDKTPDQVKSSARTFLLSLEDAEKRKEKKLAGSLGDQFMPLA